MLRYVAALAIASQIAAAEQVQETGSSRPSFAVASVRPEPGNRSSGLRVLWRPEGLTMTGISLRTLILTAYPGEARSDRIEGGPDWLATTYFTINATANPADIATSDLRLRVLRAFLEDRFGLVLRRERRDEPAYALVVAGGDGKLGPTLQRSELACDTPDRRPDQWPPACGAQARQGVIQGGDVALGRMLGSLASAARVSEVVDRTGLKGNFDYLLLYAPEQQQGGSSQTSTEYPSLFTAVEEQLGLRLQPTREPVEYFVIEHAEWPSID